MTRLEGYFIRKINWLNTLKEYEGMAKLMRKNILMDYIINIRSKVNVNKRKDKQQFLLRSDHQYLLLIEQKKINNQL